MKITLIVNALVPNSSVGRVVINIAEQFKKQNHDIQIITSEYDEEFIKRYDIDKSEIIYHRFLKLFNKLTQLPLVGFFFTLMKYNLLGFLLAPKLMRNKPDIINSHYYLCGLTGSIISKITNVPHILTLHGITLSREFLNLFLFWLINSTLNFLKRRITHFISVDPSLITSKQFIDLQDHVKVIYPCLDGQYIKLLGKGEPVEEVSVGLRLIYMGRIEKTKGLDKLIKELAKIKQKWLELKIVGSGNYESYLKKLAIQLKVAEKVKFLGFKGGLKKINVMNSSDVFISYSESEGFPLVILEFFALGKPGILFPISPFAEETGRLNDLGLKFKNEKLGIFLKKSQNSLKEILDSSKLSKFYSKEVVEARRKFVREFYPEKIAIKYLKFYRSILNLNSKNDY